MKARIENVFSLIELLVVIGIIALLISILLPSLASARSSARSTVCLSNLRQIGIQNSMYLNEYRVFPPVRLKKVPNAVGEMVVYEHDFGRRYRRAKPRWQWFLAEGLEPIINPDKYPDEEAFNASMRLDSPYFEDPAMSAFANDVRNGAYGYNGTYLGNTRMSDEDGDGEAETWIRWPVSAERIVDMGQTILAGDSRGGSKAHGNHSYWLDPPKKAVYGGDPDDPDTQQNFGPNPENPLEELGHSPVEARHRGKGAVVFADAHAELLTLTALGYHTAGDEVVPMGQIDRTIAHNKLWAGTGRDDPPLEYIYPNNP